jgi:hypothetical protein
MEKQCVKFKLNLKLLAFRGNAQNVKRIGLKILDVIMFNAKFANISSVTNAEEKNVVLQNALSLKRKQLLNKYDLIPHRIQLILSLILIIFILRNLSHEVYSYLYFNLDINITVLSDIYKETRFEGQSMKKHQTREQNFKTKKLGLGKIYVYLQNIQYLYLIIKNELYLYKFCSHSYISSNYSSVLFPLVSISNTLFADYFNYNFSMFFVIFFHLYW